MGGRLRGTGDLPHPAPRGALRGRCCHAWCSLHWSPLCWDEILGGRVLAQTLDTCYRHEFIGFFFLQIIVFICHYSLSLFLELLHDFLIWLGLVLMLFPTAVGNRMCGALWGATGGRSLPSLLFLPGKA